MGNIVIRNVSKMYKKTGKTALNSISLEIDNNVVFGLIGPNGAGKSTLIKSILGLVDIDSGTILINGRENNIGSVGYMPEETSLFEFLTGMDYLSLIGKLRDIPQHQIHQWINEMNDILQLPELNQLISTYSKGNKEKILFLSSILHTPNILILDEPFTGLDPLVIQNVKQFIKMYAQKGNTVILSTHILEMVSEICDKIGIICNGKIVSVEKNNKELGYDVILEKYLHSTEGV